MQRLNNTSGISKLHVLRKLIAADRGLSDENHKVLNTCLYTFNKLHNLYIMLTDYWQIAKYFHCKAMEEEHETLAKSKDYQALLIFYHKLRLDLQACLRILKQDPGLMSFQDESKLYQYSKSLYHASSYDWLVNEFADTILEFF